MRDNLPIPTHRKPTHPGEILKEFYLDEFGLTISDFAKHVGMTRTAVSEIVNGRRGVTPITAIRFAKALGTTEGLWLNLQFMCDMYEVKHSPEAKAAEKIKALVDISHAA